MEKSTDNKPKKPSGGLVEVDGKSFKEGELFLRDNDRVSGENKSVGIIQKKPQKTPKEAVINSLEIRESAPQSNVVGLTSPSPPKPTMKEFPFPATLTNCKRFACTEPGAILKIKVVKQWPHQTHDMPVFELSERSADYTDMEVDLAKALFQRCSSAPRIPEHYISKGKYGVLAMMDSSSGRGGELITKRIKFLGRPSKSTGRSTVKVEFIDYRVIREVDMSSYFVFMTQACSELPPRVCDLELEGLANYKDYELLRRFTRPDSAEFLFGGELTATVQSSGKILVWSRNFPRETCPFGINGYIFESMMKSLQEPKLPPLYGKRKGYIVYVSDDDEGHHYLQFPSCVSDHFMEIFDSITLDKIQKLHRSLSYPLKPETVYLAPHKSSDGTYYRAVLVENVSSTEARVRFIDYGDEATVRIEEVVAANDLDPMLSLFPPMCIKARLANVACLKSSQRYYDLYHAPEQMDRAYTIQVVQSPGCESSDLPEIILWPGFEQYENNPDKELLQIPSDESPKPRCINAEIIDKQLAQAIDPLYEYDHESTPLNHDWISSPKLYLGQEGGVRLRAGDSITVTVTHDNRLLTDNFFVIKLLNQAQEFFDFENKLNGVLRVEGPLPLHSTLCEPGNLVIFDSLLLNTVVRGVLEAKDESNNKGKTTYWKAYLMDHGITERVSTKEIVMALPQHANPPAFGIRAFIKKLDNEKKLQEWVTSVENKAVSLIVDHVTEDSRGEIAEVRCDGTMPLISL